MEPAHSMATLAAAVACEFNDELTLLLNCLSYSLDLVGREHPASERLISAQQAALRCSGITNNLLEFTRRVEARARPLPLGVLLNGR